MKAHPPLVILLLILLAGAARADGAAAQLERTPESFWERIESVIEKHLSRPYVWGASGMKSFDCSGFVWRVMHDNRILVKRSTARKYYFCLPRVKQESRWQASNIVFFDDLKHCGIIRDETSFYHASVSAGTTLSEFDPYWRDKISGIRAMPR